MTSAEMDQEVINMVHRTPEAVPGSPECIHETIVLGEKKKPAKAAPAAAPVYPSYPATASSYMPKLIAATKWMVLTAALISLVVLLMNLGDISDRLGQILIPVLSACGTGVAVASWIHK